MNGYGYCISCILCTCLHALYIIQWIFNPIQLGLSNLSLPFSYFSFYLYLLFLLLSIFMKENVRDCLQGGSTLCERVTPYSAPPSPPPPHSLKCEVNFFVFVRKFVHLLVCFLVHMSICLSPSYCLSKKQLPIPYSKLLYKMGSYFLDIQYEQKNAHCQQNLNFLLSRTAIKLKNKTQFVSPCSSTYNWTRK